jgi:hypothetical protein
VPTCPALSPSGTAAQAATKSQDEALAQGYLLVSAMRTTVLHWGALSQVRKAYGVGTKASPQVVKQVAAAITTILDRAAVQPVEAAGLGLLPKDLTALQKDLDAIVAADVSLELERALAPGSTRERNRMGNRILEAVDAIVVAGVLEFAKDAEKRAAFEALVSSGSGKKKSKGAELMARMGQPWGKRG